MKNSKYILQITILSLLLFLGCKKDNNNNPGTMPPAVASTSPGSNATNIPLNTSISVYFKTTMNAATISQNTFLVKQGNTAVAGVVTYKDSVALFKPAANLEGNKIYTCTITSGAKNIAGTSLSKDYTFSFTTSGIADNIAPMAMSVTPQNNATGVPQGNNITVNFNEAMNASTINTTTFIVKQGNTAVAGSVTYTGLIATFTPSSILSAGLKYTASISTDAKDLAGNALSSILVWDFTMASSTSTLAAVNLGTAINYVILAKTAIKNNPISNITGDLGLSPAATSYITGLSLTDATGYAVSSQVTGKVYAADMVDPTAINLTTAVNDMNTAYNDAAGRPTPDFLEFGSGNLGGKTLSPGLYKWTSTVTIPTDIAISGGANDIWIFQIAGNLTMSSAVKITLGGAAQAKNIFWQVAGEVTTGATSHFEGIILAKTGITLGSGASLKGQALAQTAVILDANTIVRP